MNESIGINPVNDEMKILANAVRLKNDFLGLGFMTRGAFIEVVQEYSSDFTAYESVKELENWWYQRAKGAELNSKIETVLNKLRYE